ncbi:hypothetical protein D7X33_45830, partial [Butyricicoccus sp. 1XD8-22]
LLKKILTINTYSTFKIVFLSYLFFTRNVNFQVYLGTTFFLKVFEDSLGDSKLKILTSPFRETTFLYINGLSL